MRSDFPYVVQAFRTVIVADRSIRATGTPLNSAHCAGANLQASDIATQDDGKTDHTHSHRVLKIGRRGPRAVRVVVEVSDPEIAFVAKQAAHLAGRMTMIDARHAEFMLAGGTPTVLLRQQRVVSLFGKPVASKACACPIFGMPSASLKLVELVPARRAPSAAACKELLSKCWIGCISLFVISSA
jgi:hypothetical protein